MTKITWTSRGHYGYLPKCQQYIYNFGVMISQVFSTLLGGDPDETISSRCGKASIAGNLFIKDFVEPLINWIFQDDKHCFRSIEPNVGSKTVWDWSK